MPPRGFHKINPARVRAEIGPTIEQQRLDALCLDVYGFLPVRKPRHKFRPIHPCRGCGARTRCVDLCRDCKDHAR